jgi:hypothetical protein
MPTAFLIPWWIEPLICTGIVVVGSLAVWVIARLEERDRK